MITVLSLLAASSALLIYASFTHSPLPSTPRSPREGLWSTLGAKFTDLKIRAGLPQLHIWHMTACSCGLGLLSGTGIQILTHIPLLAMAGMVTAAYLPWTILYSRAVSNQRRIRELWPDVLDQLTALVRTGVGLGPAMVSLAQKPSPLLATAMSAFLADYLSSGNLEKSLEIFKDKLADPIADRIAESLIIAAAVGSGRLAVLLENLSGMVRADLRTRVELEARQSWIVSAARLAVAAPWIVLALLSLQADTAAVYTSSTGTIVLFTGLLVSIGAYLTMNRLGRLATPARTLR